MKTFSVSPHNPHNPHIGFIPYQYRIYLYISGTCRLYERADRSLSRWYKYKCRLMFQSIKLALGMLLFFGQSTCCYYWGTALPNRLFGCLLIAKRYAIELIDKIWGNGDLIYYFFCYMYVDEYRKWLLYTS